MLYISLPLQEYGDDWVNTCPRRLYDKAMHTLMKQAGQQIVTLSQVRPPFYMPSCARILAQDTFATDDVLSIWWLAGPGR